MSLLLVRMYWRFSASCFIYNFLIQTISEKTLCSKKKFVLYFKEIPNSIDFYKEIFLHVIPVPFYSYDKLYKLNAFKLQKIFQICPEA